jgi:hypothetical protein
LIQPIDHNADEMFDMSKNSGNERRNYYRIQDRVALEYRLAHADQESFEQFFQLPAQHQLMSEFQLLDIEAHSLLRGITEKDRSVGAYLKVINQKMDALCRTLALTNAPIDPAHVHHVNLSEGGLSLYTHEALAPNAQLLLKLVLFPSYSGLLLRGNVLSCKCLEDQHLVHIEFVDINEQQRQLLARHILRKQQEERRLRNDS